MVFAIVNKELIKTENTGRMVSVTILSRFASGAVIDSIGRHVCKGKFRKITISDEIAIVEKRRVQLR